MKKELLTYERIIFEIGKIAAFSLLLRAILIDSKASLVNLTEVGEILFTIMNYVFIFAILFCLVIWEVHARRKEELDLRISGYDILITLAIQVIFNLFFKK